MVFLASAICVYGCDFEGVTTINRKQLLYALRSLHTGIAVLIPAILGLCLGVSVAVLTVNRRRGLNVLTRFLGRFGAWIAGMTIEVNGLPSGGLKGPGMVVLNHQSGLDPIIVCHVIETNVIGIAKKELKYNPLLGPIFWFAESIFVDRSDKEQKRATLLPVQLAFARGLIIAVAPEGRRQSTEALAAFRTGGFRLAVEAGVPVIPFVIHDSARLLGPRRTDLHPGTVHVDVLPAIDSKQWRDQPVQALTDHVYSLMLERLSRGPTA